MRDAVATLYLPTIPTPDAVQREPEADSRRAVMLGFIVGRFLRMGNERTRASFKLGLMAAQEEEGNAD